MHHSHRRGNLHNQQSQSYNPYPIMYPFNNDSQPQPVYQNNSAQPHFATHTPYPTKTFPRRSFNPAPASSIATPLTPLSPTAPPPPPGPHVPPPPQPINTLLPAETLQHFPTRASSARVKLGRQAVLEARKGLSRVLDAASLHDIHLFGEQLCRADPNAVEQNCHNDDRLLIFAVSYVQHNPSTGRFKFDMQQWQCFLDIVEHLAKSGVSKFRVWLDQCLWLRDASHGGWAHTGLLPYIMWPVISLGTKKFNSEKSVEAQTRMWPLLEEVAGLWGMGVIFAREMRSTHVHAGWRKWMSYNHRLKLEPEQGMALLLLNIFHGAVDDLQTGWQDDMTELKDMARANILMNGSELCIGSDWKQRLAALNANLKTGPYIIQELVLPVKNTYRGGMNVYLDRSRTVMSGSWNGTREWLSGHEGISLNKFDMRILEIGMKKVQVICDVGEFEMLRIGNMTSGLWLLVAMDGPTSNFSRGKVAWTKILTGLESCQLTDGNLNFVVVEQVLEAELQRRVRVISVTMTSNAIEWE